MKRYLIIFSILVLVILAFLYFPILSNMDINPFQNKNLTLKSVQSIKNIELSEFRSAEYKYKTLFPYDFIIGEPVWGTLLYKNNKFLTDQDKVNKSFYYECRNIGIDLNKNSYFFVITTNATAGFDLDAYLKDPIHSSDEITKEIILNRPESKIMSLEIVDNLKEENFPDVNISPGQWRDLITLLIPKIEKEIIDRGLLKSSDEFNMEFLEKIFISIGWESVVFK